METTQSRLESQVPAVATAAARAMRRRAYGLLVLLLAMDVTALLLQKLASIRAAAGTGGAESGSISFYANMIRHPWVWLALVLAPIQLLTWTTILGALDLSIAYPITSLGYLLTMLAAAILFGEHLGPSVWVGAMLITLGVAMVGTTERAPGPPIAP
jgi:undecaprenyl phosphate-alpha-L-ara4N flippase subunit ArnE